MRKTSALLAAALLATAPALTRAALAQTAQTPTGQTPTGQTPTGQTPTGQTPTGQTPTEQAPAGQAPAGQAQPGTPAAETPQSRGGAQGQSTRAEGAPQGTRKTKPDTYHAALDSRIAAMHRRLQITEAQEDAWNSFAQTMRQNANNVEQAYQKRAGSLKTMTAPDNLHDYARIEQLRADDVQKLAASFDTLYGQLSDEQKKTADAMFRQYDVERHQAHAAAHNKAK